MRRTCDHLSPCAVPCWASGMVAAKRSPSAVAAPAGVATLLVVPVRTLTGDLASAWLVAQPALRAVGVLIG